MDIIPGYLILLSPILLPISAFICYLIYRYTIKKNKNSYLYIGVALFLFFLLMTFNWIPSSIYFANECKLLASPILYKDPIQWSKDAKYIDYKNVILKINSQKDIPLVNGYIATKPSVIFYTRVVSVLYSKKELFDVLRIRQVIYDRKTGEILFSRDYLIYTPENNISKMSLFFQRKGCSKDDYYYRGEIYLRLIEKYES